MLRSNFLFICDSVSKHYQFKLFRCIVTVLNVNSKKNHKLIKCTKLNKFLIHLANERNNVLEKTSINGKNNLRNETVRTLLT